MPSHAMDIGLQKSIRNGNKNSLYIKAHHLLDVMCRGRADGEPP